MRGLLAGGAEGAQRGAGGGKEIRAQARITQHAHSACTHAAAAQRCSTQPQRRHAGRITCHTS
jgi:hypothetical protein